jgi:hypothetical protein
MTNEMIPLYRDQAPLRSMVFAAYTPEGNRLRESAFIRRILDLRPIRSKKRTALRQEISSDKHLHPSIIKNLLLNLRNFR